MTKDTSEFAEIEAMKAVANAIKDLDEAARARVLSWLAGRYNIQAADANSLDAQRTGSASNKKQDSGTDLPTTFAAVRPESDTDRALVGAYWFQAIKGKPDVDSEDVNSEL